MLTMSDRSLAINTREFGGTLGKLTPPRSRPPLSRLSTPVSLSRSLCHPLSLPLCLSRSLEPARCSLSRHGEGERVRARARWRPSYTPAPTPTPTPALPALPASRGRLRSRRRGLSWRAAPRGGAGCARSRLRGLALASPAKGGEEGAMPPPLGSTTPPPRPLALPTALRSSLIPLALVGRPMLPLAGPRPGSWGRCGCWYCAAASAASWAGGGRCGAWCGGLCG